MLSKIVQEALIGWEAHGPRIFTAAFHTKKKMIILNIIQCYSPTNSDEELKTSRCQPILDTYPGRDVTILRGDFNTKIGGKQPWVWRSHGVLKTVRGLQTCVP